MAIYHCDLFSVDPLILGKFDAVWDRGALVAVYPDSDRKIYAELLKQLLSEKFVYLLDTVDYDQTKYSRHPRSVPVNEINFLFGDMCNIEILEKIDLSMDHPHLTKMQWDVDEAYEIIVLLTSKQQKPDNKS